MILKTEVQVQKSELRKILVYAQRKGKKVRALIEEFLCHGLGGQESQDLGMLYGNCFAHWLDLRVVSEFEVGQLIEVRDIRGEVQDISLSEGKLKIGGRWLRASPVFELMSLNEE